ncbi:bifunctional diguanylate cyclase/phosphodiesterase, partial [Frankia sp. AgB1.8]
ISTGIGQTLVVAVILIAAFRRPRRPLGLLLLGVGELAFALSTLASLYSAIHGLGDSRPVLNLGMAVGPLLIAGATLLPPAPTPPAAGAEGPLVDETADTGARRRWWHAALPYVPLPVAAAVTLTHLPRQLGIPREVWALLALFLLALIRQMITMADNTNLVTRVEEDRLAMRRQAFHDPLTGLANRALFADRLAQALARRARAPSRLALLYCDLDDFKHINDALGHAAGDELLRVTAARLLGAVRGSDTVARLGGDEFAILLEPLTDDPEQISRRLGDAIRAPIIVADSECTVLASLGLVVVEPDSGPISPEALLHRADVAMYTAKANAAGTLTIYGPELLGPRSPSALRSALGAALSGDRAGGTLDVDYRPIVDLASRVTVAHEARLTWTHPDLGPVQPSRLVVVARSAGLIPALDSQLLRAACGHAAALRGQAGGPMPVHVVISAERFADESTTREVLEALDVTGTSPRELVLGVEATSQAPDLAAAARELEHLRALGMSISLAHLGRYDTSLSALRVLPADIVVLDSSFTEVVVGSRHEPRTAVLLNALLTAVRQLGLTVVAAGVNDEAAAARVRELGCALASGHLFGGVRTERSCRPAVRG